jgi:hypothetical protein
MTAGPQPAGFLTHQSWRADGVLARKIARGRPARAAQRIACGASARMGHRGARRAASRRGSHGCVVLVSELVTNAARHGRAGGTCVCFDRELAPA